MNDNSRFQRFLWTVAGAEISILEQKECRTDHKKFAAIGSTILMTTIIAFFAGTSAAWFFTQSGDETSGYILGSIAFGVLWATLIFTIDRSLVITLKKNPEQKKQKWVVPFFSRAVLAVLIAFMVSIPLELLVFDSLIKEKRTDYDVAEVGLYTEKSKKKTGEDKLDTEVSQAWIDVEDLKTSHAKAESDVSECYNKIQEWEKKKANPANSSSYNTAKRNYENKLTSYNTAQDRYQRGQIQYAPSYSSVAEAKMRMNQERANWEKSCEDKLKPLRIKYEELKEKEHNLGSKVDRARDSYESSKSRRDNLANQRVALEQQKKGDIASGNHFIRNFEILDWAVLPQNNDGRWMDFFFLWMIRLLFFIVEILPTVVKIVMPVGSYDRMVHAEEKSLEQYIESDDYKERLKQLHLAELEAKKKLVEQRQEIEVELKADILKQVKEAQLEIATLAVNKWREREKTKQEKIMVQKNVDIDDVDGTPV